MKKYLIYILFALPLIGFSQDATLDTTEIKQTPQEHIKILKEGKLIVRLQTKDKAFKALMKRGMVKRANYIKEEQEKLNIEIIEAFEKFNFCEVFFFYGDDSQAIKTGNFNKVKLFDSKRTKKMINLDDKFLVADFGNMPGKNKMNMESMYIMDNNLNQLSRPFPFYVRFHPTPFQNLSHKKVVAKMNKKLHEFYSQNNQ